MNTRSLCFAVVLAALASGCAPTGPILGASTPRYDATFGDAVRQARISQTLNPNASGNTDPVTGISGQAGRSAVERFHDSFKAPPPTFEILGIGASSGGR